MPQANKNTGNSQRTDPKKAQNMGHQNQSNSTAGKQTEQDQHHVPDKTSRTDPISKSGAGGAGGNRAV